MAPNPVQCPAAPGSVYTIYTEQGTLAVIIGNPGGGGGAIPAPATSHMIFVSPLYGNDTTGDGTMNTPFATIAKAQSIVNTPTLADQWTIFLLAGAYNEDVALMNFTRLVGFDPTQFEGDANPARINGVMTLGASFVADVATAAVTSVDVVGDVTLDYVTNPSPLGQVSFTLSNLAENVVLTMGATNATEFHQCTIDGGDYTQLGGNVRFVNTSGMLAVLNMHIVGRLGTPTNFTAWGGGWQGPVFVDQNGVTDQDITVNLNGFQVGPVTVTASGAKNPTINAALGATPENPTLAGSAAVALSPGMRVTKQGIIPSGTVIAAAGTTAVTIPLTAGVLGATSIEAMNCSCELTGADWVDAFTTQKLAVSWVFVQNGTVSEIHCLIYTAGAGFTLSASLPFTFFAFLPIAVPT